MKKLTDTAFKQHIAKVSSLLGEALPLKQEKEINYGHQYVMQLADAKLTLNMYNGKKGLSYVFSGDSALEGRAREALASYVVCDSANATEEGEPEAELPQGLWAGSDESGKGDFFGSLVVAATIVDDTTAAKLQAAGVKDCKLLTDQKILELDEVIKQNVVDYSILELKPQFYNLRYEQVAAQGGNLNQLLGSGHVNALSQVLERHEDCHAALIDQFTKSTVNLQALRKRFPACVVSQRPKAESNLAVAAASVLARARFLQTLAELAAAAGEAELPKGGGEHCTACARRLAKRLGRDALRNYVKLHFANYKRI
jgi:ribonuclease HIII